MSLTVQCDVIEWNTKYELVLTTDLISDINQKPIQKKKSIDFYKVLNAN